MTTKQPTEQYQSTEASTKELCDLSLKVDNVTKIYRLYNKHVDRLKESINPFKKKYHRDFYALSNVSFEVRKGETVGIIGRNGSGKSTLLKIITGVLTPTNGGVMVNGTTAALLELGTGFNPELTGIDNIYFSGTIMGFSQENISNKLDAILSFADIGGFVQQPVKTYSSGMFVRLAFALAINVEPDILIVDEALAVGDEAFQRKCYSKIQAIQERGTTILFVTHSTGTVIELCQKALLIDQGELLLEGISKLVVSKYNQLLYAAESKRDALRNEILCAFNQQKSISDEADKTSNSRESFYLVEKTSKRVLKEFYDPDLKPHKISVYSDNNDYGVKISDVKITTISGIQVNNLLSGKEYIYTYKVVFHKPAVQVRFGMLIKTVTGFEIGGAASSNRFDTIALIEEKSFVTVKFRFKCLLHYGTYFVNAGVVGIINDNEVYFDRIIDALMFRVQPDESIFETGTVSFLVEPSYSIEKK